MSQSHELTDPRQSVVDGNKQQMTMTDTSDQLPKPERAHPAVDRYRSWSGIVLGLYTYDVNELVNAAIDSFLDKNAEHSDETVTEIREWLGNWTELPGEQEMERGMNMLGKLFFLQSFKTSGLQFKWETAASLQNSLGMFCPPVGRGLWLVKVRRDDFLDQLECKDQRSAVVSVLLHELCHAYLTLFSCLGGCGRDACVWRDLHGVTGHTAPWFFLAVHVEFVARRLLPELEISLSPIRSIAFEYFTFHQLKQEGGPPKPSRCWTPSRRDWQRLTERFSDREVADLLNGITTYDDRVLRQAYITDAFFGSRGLRVGIRRMTWARDGLLSGFKLVDVEMVVTRSEILDTVPSDANMDLATAAELETQKSYPPMR